MRSSVRFPRRPRMEDPAIEQYLKDLEMVLIREFGTRLPDTEGKSSMLLIAPDSSIWSLSISNAGALVTTKVFG